MKATVRAPRILLVWVGRSGDSPLDVTTEQYLDRIDRMAPAAIRRVRPAGGDGAAAIAEESKRLLAEVEGAGRVWLFDVGGERVDSVRLSERLAADLAARPPLAVIIGGAAGVDESLRRRADRRISLSPLTFPHALARLVAAEQLYRALTLVEGLPYHK